MAAVPGNRGYAELLVRETSSTDEEPFCSPEPPTSLPARTGHLRLPSKPIGLLLSVSALVALAATCALWRWRAVAEAVPHTTARELLESQEFAQVAAYNLAVAAPVHERPLDAAAFVAHVGSHLNNISFNLQTGAPSFYQELGELRMPLAHRDFVLATMLHMGDPRVQRLGRSLLASIGEAIEKDDREGIRSGMEKHMSTHAQELKEVFSLLLPEPLRPVLLTLELPIHVDPEKTDFLQSFDHWHRPQVVGPRSNAELQEQSLRRAVQRRLGVDKLEKIVARGPGAVGDSLETQADTMFSQLARMYKTFNHLDEVAFHKSYYPQFKECVAEAMGDMSMTQTQECTMKYARAAFDMARSVYHGQDSSQVAPTGTSGLASAGNYVNSLLGGKTDAKPGGIDQMMQSLGLASTTTAKPDMFGQMMQSLGFATTTAPPQRDDVISRLKDVMGLAVPPTPTPVPNLLDALGRLGGSVGGGLGGAFGGFLGGQGQQGQQGPQGQGQQGQMGQGAAGFQQFLGAFMSGTTTTTPPPSFTSWLNNVLGQGPATPAPSPSWTGFGQQDQGQAPPNVWGSWGAAPSPAPAATNWFGGQSQAAAPANPLNNILGSILSGSGAQPTQASTQDVWKGDLFKTLFGPAPTPAPATAWGQWQ